MTSCRKCLNAALAQSGIAPPQQPIKVHQQSATGGFRDDDHQPQSIPQEAPAHRGRDPSEGKSGSFRTQQRRARRGTARTRARETGDRKQTPRLAFWLAEEAVLSSSARLSRASAAVSPTTTRQPGKLWMVVGRTPSRRGGLQPFIEATPSRLLLLQTISSKIARVGCSLRRAAQDR